VTGVLAFLTQYDTELGGTVLATVIVGFGVWQLLTGKSPDLRRFRPGTIRVVGAAQILVGVAFGVTSFRMNREPNWGGTPQIVVLTVWLAAIGAITLVQIRKYRTYEVAPIETADRNRTKVLRRTAYGDCPKFPARLRSLSRGRGGSGRAGPSR
jgi:hypothetical protein